MEQEESYTSQASFLGNDTIPVYKNGDTAKYVFSGKRSPTKYKNQYKKSGFRGLYQNADGMIINSDLKGSANIGRKVFPELFTVGCVNFNNVEVIKHPDNMKCSPVLG